MVIRLAVKLGSLCVCCAIAACGASTTTTPSAPAGTPTSSPTASVVATATPSPTPAPTPTAAVLPGAASPVIAVQDVAEVDPNTGEHPSGDCNGSTYLVPPCPVTPRLGARLDSHPFSGSGGGADPLCRCQGESGAPLTFTLISESGTTAYVHEDLGFGPSHDLRWTVVSTGGRWYVDDQDTGCSTTSIYNPAYDFTDATSTPAPPVAAC